MQISTVLDSSPAYQGQSPGGPWFASTIASVDAGRAGDPYRSGTHKYALGSEAEKTMERVTREFFHFASAALVEQMIANTLITNE